MRVFDRSPVPMALVDADRRYVRVNPPARLAFRLSLAQLRELRIDDLAPPSRLPVIEEAWARLAQIGWIAGSGEVAPPDGGVLPIMYCAIADASPGLHLIAFAPADWLESELLVDHDPGAAEPTPRLTPRELDVLELAAEGRTGPMIARELVLSSATVRTHFENIYSKLGVRDRAAAVAKAMRLGLIT
jgi:DNA-binding CsgD family transcriptional regulator